MKDVLHDWAKQALGEDFIAQIERTSYDEGVIGPAIDSIRKLVSDKKVNKVVVCAQTDRSMNLFRDALTQVCLRVVESNIYCVYAPFRQRSLPRRQSFAVTPRP